MPRSTRTWLLGALPALAFLATFGLFFVHKNREARTVFSSGRGLLTVAALFLGYVALAFVLRRLVKGAWVAPVVLSAVILALAGWIVRPYYVDDTANRQLVAGQVSVGAPAQSAPALPVRISSGSLRGIGHSASGSAAIIRNPDGSLVLRFEGFAIEGSPDPRVYLVQGNDKRSPGGVSFGRMEGNKGQVLDYAVPPGTEAGPGWTVLVWCGRFSTPIANATQSAI
jgi:hypothetical protein